MLMLRTALSNIREIIITDTDMEDMVAGNIWSTASLKRWVLILKSSRSKSRNISEMDKTLGSLPTVKDVEVNGKTSGLLLWQNLLMFLKPVLDRSSSQLLRWETLLIGHGNKAASSVWMNQLISKTCQSISSMCQLTSKSKVKRTLSWPFPSLFFQLLVLQTKFTSSFFASVVPTETSSVSKFQSRLRS